jgi:hypothetical protein
MSPRCISRQRKNDYRLPVATSKSNVSKSTITRPATRVHDFVRRLQLWDSQVTTDFPGQKVIDFTMSWNRTCLIITWIEVKTVLSALSKQLASMRL